MNKISNVAASHTYKLFTQLKSKGFNVELKCHFDYLYNAHNKYLSIHISNGEMRINELFECCNMHGCEILVIRYAIEPNVKLEARKPAIYAEFIHPDIWHEFSKTPPFLQ